VVLGLRVGPVFRKVTFADAFELERPLPARAGFLDGVGGQLEQDLTGEGVVLRVQRLEERGQLAELQIISDARRAPLMAPKGGVSGTRRSASAART